MHVCVLPNPFFPSLLYFSLALQFPHMQPSCLITLSTCVYPFLTPSSKPLAYGLHLDPFLLSLNTLTPHTTTHMCVPASCHLVCEREGEKEMWPGLGGHTLPRGKLPPRSDKSWHSCTPIPPSCLSSVSLDRHLQSPPAHGHPHEDERSLPSLCCKHTRRSMSSMLASPPYTP
jgi:hypothetical protein